MTELSALVKSLRLQLETDRLAGIEEVFIKTAKKADIESIRGDAEGCKKCGLHKKRTNLVFGTGDMHAQLMFIGEAPGEDEDLKGEPFVGRAGQLLTKMIEAIGLKRQDVYIANILKCRPPNNRNPLPEEIAACSHFLSEQIKAIKPKVVCTLGKFSSQFLLQSQLPISALRGKFYEIDGVKVMPTFHPAYLLRNPSDKRLVWEDLKKIIKEVGRDK